MTHFSHTLATFLAIVLSISAFEEPIMQQKINDSYDIPYNEPVDPSTGAFVRLSLGKILSNQQIAPTAATTTTTTILPPIHALRRFSRGAQFRTIEREEPDPLTQQRQHRVTLPPSFKRPGHKSNVVPSEAVPRSPGSSEAPPVQVSTSDGLDTSSERPVGCFDPMTTGPCKAYFLRWAYNPYTQKCQPFVYGGCEGNRNMFKYSEDCVRNCKATGLMESLFTYPVETK